MQLARRLIPLAAFLVALATGALAQPVPGKDYRLVDPPQPTDSGNKIEVLEFFWYGCPHCNALQPPLNIWLKKKPADVEFKRVPAVLADSWLPLTRTYYTLDAMGAVEKLHHEVFTAVHEQNVRLSDPKVLFDWVAKRGLDQQKFADIYNSFGVQSRARRSVDLTKQYDIPGTPALTVDGKFLVAPSMVLKPNNSVDYERYFQVLDQVIAIARKARAGK